MLAANILATCGGTITPSNHGETLTTTGTVDQVDADLTNLTDSGEPVASETITVDAGDNIGSTASPAAIAVPVVTRTAVYWLNPVSGDWNDNSTDWSVGVPPVAGANVALRVAGAYTVSITSQIAAIKSLTIGASGATLSINDPGITQSAIGSLTNHGTIGLIGTSALTVGGDFANSGLLDLDTGSFDGGGSLTIGGTLTNVRTVRIGPSDDTLSAATTLTLGGLTNTSGASFQVFGSSSYSTTVTVNGNATSAGLLDIGAFANLTINAGRANFGGLTNNGVLEAANGGAIVLTGEISGTGQLKVGTGSVIELASAVDDATSFIGSGGRLRLDTPSTYTGTITGFDPGDVIELADTDAISATPAFEGSYTTLTIAVGGGATLTFTLSGNPTTDVFIITHVNGGKDSEITIQRPQLTGQVILSAATEGTALPAATMVASFTDSNLDEGAGAFTATIDWGDGTTSPGTVSGGNGAFVVAASHTYGDEGSAVVGVTITDTLTGAAITPSGTVTVGEGDVLVAHPANFLASANTPFTGIVATFDNIGFPGNLATHFSATIDWGDGSLPTNGIVGGGNGTLTVAGSHTYTAAGTATLTVTLRDDPPGTAAATALSTATVMPQLAGQVILSAATEGTALPAATMVASFTDSNLGEDAGAFTATIDWGDGTTSPGTVSGGNGAFVVAASHTYGDEGSAVVGVTITDTLTGAAITPSGTVTVGEGDVLVAHPASFLASANTPFTGIVATFDNIGFPGNLATHFSATIDWGDGSPPTSGIVGGGNGTFTVAGSHTYTAAGSATLTVTLRDDPPGTTAATALSTATVTGVPVITAPLAATVGVGRTGAIAGVSIAESPATSGENFTVTLVDTSGMLSATGTGVSGLGTTGLTVSGSLSQVNSALGTLTDIDTSTAVDTITINASDSNGGLAAPASITVTVNGVPAVASPATATVQRKQATPITGISVLETGNTTTGGETFTVVLADSNGMLAANIGASGGGGTITSSNGGKTLTIAGTLAQVNADLTTLTDTEASFVGGTITVDASDSFGNTASQESIALSVVQQSTLFDFVFTYLDGKDYYYGTASDDGTFGYYVGQLITTASGQYDIYHEEGDTTTAAGTVSVTYYSHGGPGQASYIPAIGEADGSSGLGSEADSILGTDGLQHPFSASSEAVIATNSLYGFVFNYLDGGAFYSGTVADDGTYGYPAIASSFSPFLSVSGGNYYIFSEGSTAEASGTVIVNYYHDGSIATTFPIDHLVNGVSDGGGGLGSETGYFLSGGDIFKFTNAEEAADPPLPGGVVAVWAFDGTTLVGGAIVGDTGWSWQLVGVGSSSGDGNIGVLWQKNGGEVATWQASQSTLFDDAGFGNPGPSWLIAETGDYAGNGTSGIQWQNDAGQTAYWVMGGATPTVRTVIDIDPGATWHLQAS